LNDQVPPEAEFAYPLDSQNLQTGLLELEVQASDTMTGISHVDFLYHSSDWHNDDWVYLGSDWNDSDGWKLGHNISTPPEPPGIAYYAYVFDWAGNWTGVGAWKLKNPDMYLPGINR
jgi:hypothetical protein